jgi:hypothetical protein
VNGSLRRDRLADRFGIVLSVGCAVHCVTAPLILLVAPLIGGIWVHPGVHLTIALLVLPVAAWALRRGMITHGRRAPLVLGVLGMLLVAVGVVWPFVLSTASAGGHCMDCCPTLLVDDGVDGDGGWSLRVPPASIVTMLGGALLVAAHAGNLRACRGPSVGHALSAPASDCCPVRSRAS